MVIRKLFQKLPGLRELLTSRTFIEEVMRMVDEPVYYVARSYYIDRDGDFFGRKDDVRYRHCRTESVLTLKTPADSAAAVEEATGSQGDLFDADAV